MNSFRTREVVPGLYVDVLTKDFRSAVERVAYGMLPDAVDVKDATKDAFPELGAPAEPDPERIARALFDEQLWEEAQKRAEFTETRHGSYFTFDGRPGAEFTASVRRILDVMWAKTKPTERAECERRALWLTQLMKDAAGK